MGLPLGTLRRAVATAARATGRAGTLRRAVPAVRDKVTGAVTTAAAERATPCTTVGEPTRAALEDATSARTEALTVTLAALGLAFAPAADDVLELPHPVTGTPERWVVTKVPKVAPWAVTLEAEK